MTTTSVAAKPTPIWRRSVKFDVKPVFKGVTKALTHVATGKVEELGNDVAETLGGLGLNVPPNEMAYLLIKRALFAAANDLAQESISHLQLDESAGLPEIGPELEEQLDNLKISLDKSFLEKPAKLKILSDIVPLYAQWLKGVGVPPLAANVIAKRLPSYFVYALSDEWRRNSASYKQLIESIRTPFSAAEEREKDWENYNAMLVRRTNENVFDEPFSLTQIYVPLRAYYQQNKKDAAPGATNFSDRQEKVVIDLEKELLSWLAKGDRTDAVRVISGGPGSGKSSFTKMFCAALAENKVTKPIYIPLHLIDPTREIADEVAKFVKDEGYLRFNPLDQEFQESNLLLVFDGLDELASQGKVAAQVARNFVQAVERMVERRNLGSSPISVLISGRELVIQENETEFRRPKQILSVLPYFVPKDEHRDYIDSGRLLNVDSRDTWWAKYGLLCGHDFDKLPPNLKRVAIDEITSQPLLNYLVALSFTRGKLNFDTTLNLNKIYADLVTAVYERGYEKRTYKPISHISAREFERVLEEIGLAAWHASDGRSTSVNEILEHCRESGLEALVATFQEGAKAGVTKLLAAFFFRKNGQHSSGDATFVFTHKSFGEYLTAVRIVRGIERIVTQLERRRQNPDDGFDVSEGLLHWVKLVGPAQLTQYIHDFLSQEISQRERSQINLWKSHLTEMLSRAVDRGMPMEKAGSFTFFEAMRRNNNASETLLIAVNACAVALRDIIRVEWMTPSSFGTFLKRTCPQREGPVSPLLYTALSFFDFSNQCIDMLDLYGAELSNTIWSNAAMHYANLSTARLMNADFTCANIGWSDFSHSNLEHATLKNVFGHRVDFTLATLASADLSDADLAHSIFDRARLNGDTKLIQTNLFGVELSKVHKTGTVDFSKIELIDPDLDRQRRRSESVRTHSLQKEGGKKGQA